MIHKIIDKVSVFHVILFVAFFYFLLPTNNASLDAYHYAANIKYGEELFSPHHLLYNAFLYLLIYPVKQLFNGVDILLLSNYINSFFSLVNLILFYKILSECKPPKKEKLLYILMVAFSFSLWRYGTENEVYVIPITFSLLGSFYFLKHIKTERLKYIFLSGLFASIACLFHQIHVFWWLGLLIGVLFYLKKRTAIIAYCSTVFILPISYMLVLVFYQHQPLSATNISHFVFHDFYTGSASSEFSWKNLFFILLNSFRTFFQIHPTIFILIKRNFLFGIPIVLLIYSSFILINTFLKKTLFIKREHTNNLFVKTHQWIITFHFLFAFYAVGNIEFMIMLPFLLVISFLINYKINYEVLSVVALTLFIWNFSYGIYPNTHYNHYNDDVLLEFIIKHPDDVFVVKNSDMLNKYYYKTGTDNYKNIILSKDIKSTTALQKLFSKKQYIYTDVIDKPSIFNRAAVISINTLEFDFKNYKKEKIVTYQGLYGTSVIYKISP